MTLAIDTSAIVALYLGEPSALWISDQLSAADRLVMSTVNLTECLIVLRQRSPERFDTLHEKLTSSSIEFIPPDIEQSTLAASARLKFPLNLGDCFAYALAATLEIALLTLDRDFRATDIQILNPPVQS